MKSNDHSSIQQQNVDNKEKTIMFKSVFVVLTVAILGALAAPAPEPKAKPGVFAAYAAAPVAAVAPAYSAYTASYVAAPYAAYSAPYVAAAPALSYASPYFAAPVYL